MCCDISSSLNTVFIVWTVAGVLSFVLAFVCTFEIVRQTRGGRKQGDDGIQATGVLDEEELIFPQHAE